MPMTTSSLPGLLAMLRRVHSARGRQREGLYSIEGTRLVERALRSGAPLESVLVAQRLVESGDPRHQELFRALAEAGCAITVAPDEVLTKLTEGRDLGPILGLVRLPAPPTLSNVLGSGRTITDNPQPTGHTASVPPLILAAVDIVDPGNVGALTRTAHAAGASALAAVGASDPFHPRATRISRGSIFRLPVLRYDTAGALLADLRAHDVFIVAASAAGGTPLGDLVAPMGAVAVLMGNEAEGLPPGVQSAVDAQVTIPMAAGVDSFSVNAAAAIVLYAIIQSRPRLVTQENSRDP